MSFEPIARLSVFLGVFAIMAIWEVFAPKRAQIAPKSIRFSNNIALMVLNTFILRLVFPMGAVGFAIFCQNNSIGLFNLIGLPPFLEIILALILLDLLIYFQHVLFHSIPFLWRLHRVHHLDTEIDVSTAGRFHTFEIILSLGIKLLGIALLGADAVAVLVFEIILNACAMFNHANVWVSPKIDAVLRKFIVTPDMHRIHHSIDPKEFNSNFGFNISLWDRVFNTYTQEPKHGHLEMQIGQNVKITNRDLWLDRLLLWVFSKPQK